MKKIIGDGWSKFEEQFSGMILRNNESFVQASFDMPPTTHHHHSCFQPVLRAVSGMVNQTIHTMIAAGNIDGAITALGGKKTQNIVELVKQEKLEEQAKIEADVNIYKNIKKNAKKLKIALADAERIKRQLDELDNRFASMLKENCHICMEKLVTPVMEPFCQNLFCGKCLLTWLQKAETCPLCRDKVDTNDLVYLTCNKDAQNVPTPEHTGKKQLTPLETVINILNENKKGKFIIFSAYNATFKPICKILTESKVIFSQVKGTGKSRQKSIESFKHGDTQVMLLNSKFNGAGINLQEATGIILYHEMTASTENQIIGRAKRIGRTEPLQVHHLQVSI